MVEEVRWLSGDLHKRILSPRKKGKAFCPDAAKQFFFSIKACKYLME